MPSYRKLRRDSISSDGDSSDTIQNSQAAGLLQQPPCKELIIEDWNPARRPKSPWFTWKTTCMHIGFIMAYSFIFVGVLIRNARTNALEKVMIHSPANVAIEYEKKTVHAKFDNKNPYKGKPSDELDHAWHELFVNSNIRVSAEDLRKINRTSVPVNDAKGGYYAIPDVYHQLHCLKYLRQVLYGEYYELKHLNTKTIHIDHCIDSLRQNLMCKGDVSLLTFDWVPDDRAPKPNFDIEHKCVNWEKLDNWARENRFEIFDEMTLVHPTLGPSFPKEEYNATGRVPGHPDFRPNVHHETDADDLHSHDA